MCVIRNRSGNLGLLTILTNEALTPKDSACRTLTSRRFINFTREDLEKRRVKYEEAMRALQPQHKQLSKAQIDAFFERLIVDSESRGRKR